MLTVLVKKVLKGMAKNLRCTVFWVLAMLMVFSAIGCDVSSPVAEDLYFSTIYSTNGYFTNLYIAGVPVGDNVTGSGTAGRLTQWAGPASITDATNTDAQVAGAVANSHAQNTDIILTTNGAIALINAGVLVNDLKTDRWLFDDRNTFLGVGVVGAGNLAHTALIEGYENTAIGCDAASSITTGYSNTFVGHDAGESITTGYNNTAVGADAASNISTGDSNAAFGDQALMNNTGGKNAAIGTGAMGSATGDYNTAVGTQTLNSSAGSQNTAIGVWAGTNNIGNNNVFLGFRAGEDNVGSDKLYIDNSDDPTPLIYGDFSIDKVTINEDLDVADDIAVLGSVCSNLIPTDNSTYDLGSATVFWEDAYIETLHVGTIDGGGGGGGDMLKATYDTDADNIVDKAENVDDGVGNASTAAQVKTAVTNSHAQDTDTILKNGGIDLINAGTLKSNLAVDAAVTIDGVDVSSLSVGAIEFIIDGGGIVIATGEKGHLEISYACTLTQWTLLANVGGAIKIDVWRSNYAGFPPINAGSLCNAHEPEIAAVNQKAQDLDISDWADVTLDAGDIISFNVDSCATITRCTISIRITR